MVIIYDFDGTLTPYPFTKYEIMKICGYGDLKLQLKIRKNMRKKNDNVYHAFVDSIFEILKENDFPQTIETICLGADKIIFNKGVLEYFKALTNTEIHHYVLTSGFEEYVRRTKINPYLKEIYGTTILPNSTIIKRLVTAEYKPIIIKEILESEQITGENIIYIGDGITDKYAFEYVHSIGGKCIYLSKKQKKDKNYQQLNNSGIIDECFYPDYSIDKPIYKYIKKLTK